MNVCFGSVADSLAQFGVMAAFEGLAAAPWLTFQANGPFMRLSLNHGK